MTNLRDEVVKINLVHTRSTSNSVPLSKEATNNENLLCKNVPKDLLIRTSVALGISFFFILINYLGPMAIIPFIILIQAVAYWELINVGAIKQEVDDNSNLRPLAYYHLVVFNLINLLKLVDHANCFGIGEDGQPRIPFLYNLKVYETIISFMLAFIGLICFVIILKGNHPSRPHSDKGNYMKKFGFYCYILTGLFLIAIPSWMAVHNLMYGICWWLFPTILTFFNDTAAYFCGSFWPLDKKHKLISLSPNKTWEGYLGAAVMTVIFGSVTAYLVPMIDFFSFLFCPMQVENPIWIVTACSKTSYIPWTPMHNFIIVGFISIFGPFGGFLASGIKRAVKDPLVT